MCIGCNAALNNFYMSMVAYRFSASLPVFCGDYGYAVGKFGVCSECICMTKRVLLRNPIYSAAPAAAAGRLTWLIVTLETHLNIYSLE